MQGTPGMAETHTDKEYAAQLEALRSGLLAMAERVQTMIANSVTALVERDKDLARRTIENDHLINRAEVENDELCLLILAKWQPMASDLRGVTLALKMVTDLERIGDLAVNICERALDLADAPQLKPWEDIPRMAELAREMVRDAIDAFVEEDVGKARHVIERDNEADALYTRIFREILDVMCADARAVERGIHVQSVAKWLERISDHSTNLAEQVIFLVKGKDVRHVGKLDAG